MAARRHGTGQERRKERRCRVGGVLRGLNSDAERIRGLREIESEEGAALLLLTDEPPHTFNSSGRVIQLKEAAFLAIREKRRSIEFRDPLEALRVLSGA